MLVHQRVSFEWLIYFHESRQLGSLGSLSRGDHIPKLFCQVRHHHVNRHHKRHKHMNINIYIYIDYIYNIRKCIIHETKKNTTPRFFSDLISLYPSISLLKSPWMLSPAFPRQRPVASLVVLLSLIRLPHGLGFVDHAIDLRIAQTTAAADGDGLLLACKMMHIFGTDWQYFDIKKKKWENDIWINAGLMLIMIFVGLKWKYIGIWLPI